MTHTHTQERERKKSKRLLFHESPLFVKDESLSLSLSQDTLPKDTLRFLVVAADAACCQLTFSAAWHNKKHKRMRKKNSTFLGLKCLFFFGEYGVLHDSTRSAGDWADSGFSATDAHARITVKPALGGKPERFCFWQGKFQKAFLLFVSICSLCMWQNQQFGLVVVVVVVTV